MRSTRAGAGGGLTLAAAVLGQVGLSGDCVLLHPACTRLEAVYQELTLFTLNDGQMPGVGRSHSSDEGGVGIPHHQRFAIGAEGHAIQTQGVACERHTPGFGLSWGIHFP